MSATAPTRTTDHTPGMSEHSFRRLSAPAAQVELKGERLLAFQALRLWQRLTAALVSAYGEGERDRMKRIRRVRGLAAGRAERRTGALAPATRLPLGNLRRDPTARGKIAESAKLAAAA